MESLNQRFSIRNDKFRNRRKELGLSYGALAAAIKGLDHEPKYQVGKAELHRIEHEATKIMKLGSIRAIERALGLPEDELVYRDIRGNAAPQQYFTTLSKIVTGAELSEMRSKANLVEFHVESEPSSEEAQDAIIKLVELSTTKPPSKLAYGKRIEHEFNIRRCLEVLKKNNLNVHAKVEKLIAPFQIYVSDEYSEPEVAFQRVAPDFVDNWGMFEGTGICESLVVNFSESNEQTTNFPWTLDPANLVHERTQDPYLREMLERFSIGVDLVDFQTFSSFEENEFYSAEACQLFIKEKKEKAS